MKNCFEELYSLNVNEFIEKKNGLNYLSWSYATAEILKRYPDMTYEILRFDNNLPYVYDDKTGYMVFTKVTIGETTREMWLPVMDSANKAMLDHDYTYEVKKKEWDNTTKRYVYTTEEKTCKKATMFDVNKTIMRCLTKNFAMFGLGLYIYNGDDLPEEEATKKIEKEQITKIRKLIPEENMDAMLKYYKIEKLEDMLFNDAVALIERKENANGKDSKH